MAVKTWVLPQRITDLSVAKDWSQAVREWVPDGIEILEDGVDACLCGHAIKELCYIRNTKNHRTAIVGNHCIQKFEKGSEGHAAFASVPKIIRGAKRILGDPAAAANEALIDLASRKGLFTPQDAQFYLDTLRKRALTWSQKMYRTRLNRKLLFGVIYQTGELYRKLNGAPRALAGMKLVDYAVSKGVLTDKNREFYLTLWNRPPSWGALSDPQTRYRDSLNRRMIEQLRADLQPAPPAEPVAKRRRLD